MPLRGLAGAGGDSDDLVQEQRGIGCFLNREQFGIGARYCRCARGSTLSGLAAGTYAREPLWSRADVADGNLHAEAWIGRRHSSRLSTRDSTGATSCWLVCEMEGPRRALTDCSLPGSHRSRRRSQPAASALRSPRNAQSEKSAASAREAANANPTWVGVPATRPREASSTRVSGLTTATA